MKKRTVNLVGAIAEEARKRGTNKPGHTPADGSADSAAEDQNKVAEKDGAAQVEITVSDDKMKASMRFLSPPQGNCPALTEAHIEKVLAGKKIIAGVNKALIPHLVTELSATAESKKNILIAEGKPPIDGKDATLVFKTGEKAENKDREAGNFVRPGQVIAEIIPPTEAVNGVDVYGKEITARNGKPCDIKAGENVTLSEDNTAFRAEIYGVVSQAYNSISVTPPLTISDDAMRVDLRICPTLSDNSSLQTDDILGLLQHAGIVHGILKGNIEAALKPDQPIQTVLVAQGTAPKDGEDATFEYYFTLNNQDPEALDSERRGENPIDEEEIQKEMFSAGELLAEKIPSVAAEDGCTVYGKVINAKQPRDRQLITGEGVKRDDNGLQYIVDEAAMGYANYIDGTLLTENPIQISEDRLEAMICVHSPSESARLLTSQMVKDRLVKLGIKQGIDKAAILEAGRLASNKTGTFHRLLIAKGKAPQNGEDARFKFFFQKDKQPGKCRDDSGSIDFKERGTIQNARAGGKLAQKIPPTSGIDGFDVFGNLLKADRGKDWNLIPMGGVSVTEDGQIYRAETDGMITVVGEGRIGVFNAYEIQGDVDFCTGNLDMKGTLIINGCVREGFSVKASGDIFVAQGVENSTLRCGANLKVNRGILGNGKSIVVVRGDVHSDFIESARINAGGNVVVNNSIVRSLITSKGLVDVSSGKGRIMGGTVFALKGVKAGEIGSETGIETIIQVGRPPKALKVLARDKKYLASLHKDSRRINLTIGSLVKKSQTGALNQKEKLMLEKLNKLKRRAVMLENRQTQYQKILIQELFADEASIEVEVKKAVHEGTIIIVRGYPLKVVQSFKGKGKFVLNKDKQIVEFI